MEPLHQDVIASFDTILRSYRQEGTVAQRVYYLRRLAAWAERQETTLWDLSFKDLQVWLTKDVGPSPWTKRSAKNTLSTFYQWAVATGQISDNPAANLPSIRAPEGIPRPCPEEVIQRGLERATRHIDVLMILLGELQAMRAGEIAHAHTSDIQGDYLRVLGKGNKVRVIPLHPLVKEVLEYIPRGYLFPSDKNPTGHMLPRSIGARVRWLLDGNGWNAHSLRHRFGVEALEENPDLMALRDIMGHASVSTTQIYTKASAQRLKKMVEGVKAGPGREQRMKQMLRAA